MIIYGLEVAGSARWPVRRYQKALINYWTDLSRANGKPADRIT